MLVLCFVCGNGYLKLSLFTLLGAMIFVGTYGQVYMGLNLDSSELIVVK